MYIGVAHYTSSELLIIHALDAHKPNNTKVSLTTMYTEQTKQRPNTVSVLIILVEARGFEPLSENNAT
jgi:hypothetical protein